ncbi:MAG: ribosome biogenesis GTPase YlqF [Bacillota bacterium]|nr:ribosome biogenesis GTPase YlqF [Bacillota bacterium]
MNDIQWYPGHMVKAKKLIKEHLKVIDIVVELLDARAPSASRNPELIGILGNKPLVLVLNKADLADPTATRSWIEHYNQQGRAAVAINATSKEGIKALIKCMQEQLHTVKEKQLTKGRINYLPRIMVVGIPNVGKSSLINSLGGKASAKTGNKPGITKGQQWIKLNDFHLLDVPGVLWPKFENQEIGFRLAASGAIGDHVFNVEAVVIWLLDYLRVYYPANLAERYKLAIELENVEPLELLKTIGAKRGCLVAGGNVDILKSAEIVLREFREGKIGRVTLEQDEVL